MRRPKGQPACIAVTLAGACLAFNPVLRAGIDPAKAITQYHHDVWTTEQGLPQNTVTAITQTRDGYIWIGTELGLARFDGLRFQVFNKKNTAALKSNMVNALVEDRQGDLWVGTAGGGLTRLSHGVFATFTAKEGLPNEVVLSLYEDHTGVLWIGTDGGGLIRFHDGKFTAFSSREGLPDNSVYAIAEDRAGNLWAGTHAGLARFHHGTFSIYTTRNGLPNDYVKSLIQARDRGLWIGTNGGGLSRLKEGRIERYTTKTGLPSDAISALSEDQLGNLWVGTFGAGIARMAGGATTVYGTKDGLSNDDVDCFFMDHEGALWIGTTGGGINRLADAPILTYDTQEGLSNETALAVFEDHTGSLWIGTNGGGVNRFREGRFEAISVGQGLPDNFVVSIAEDREGGMWFGTRKGLAHLQNGKFTVYTKKDGLPSDIAMALYTDRNDNLWIGTRAGLSRFSQGVFHNYTTENGMSNNVVLAIQEDLQGNLWIGTGGGGLNRLSKDGKFQIFDSKRGLSGDMVMCIHVDADGVVWAGTSSNGLNRLKDGKITVYTTREGLPVDGFFRILEDDSHNLWMSSDDGIIRVNKQQLNDLAAGRIRALSPVAYSTSVGMKSKECNGAFQPAGWKARDGRLWFPTMKGVVAIDPRHLGQEIPAPDVILEQVNIDRHEMQPAAKPVRVPPGSGELEIRYTAIGFRDAGAITFRYKLEGFDSDWVEAGNRRAAFYTNIPPGSYRFRVTARNEYGTWNAAEGTLSFTLEPHFYQAVWYYVLWLLGVAGLTALVPIIRVRQLRRREKELSERVEERTEALRREMAERERAEEDLLKAKEAEQASRIRTEFLANVSHEIRTPINGILGMAELALKSKPTSEQAEYLGTVRNCANSLLAVVNDIVDFSHIQAGKLRLDAIEFRLHDNIGETLKIAGIQAKQKGLGLRSRIEADVPELVSGDPIRLRQVLLNLLGNGVKFTERGEVAMQVECAAREDHTVELHFVVRDTGIGIAPEKQALIFEGFSQGDSSINRKHGGSGLGLAIAQQLVQLMGGKIWVESESGRGSAFHFTARVASVDDSQKTKTSCEPSSGRQFASLHILLAEDNLVNQKIGKGLLHKRGHSVVIAKDGSEAVSFLAREAFDIVLMDIQMPVMDGLKATRLIRESEKQTGQHVPIVAVTAHAVEGYKTQCTEVGMDAFLSKPLVPELLFETVESLARPVHAAANAELTTPV
jgi:signal transduction histidine kinase/ligand-binding sensor domain-containing protein/CheY-like chemotaxis protein